MTCRQSVGEVSLWSSLTASLKIKVGNDPHARFLEALPCMAYTAMASPGQRRVFLFFDRAHLMEPMVLPFISLVQVFRLGRQAKAFLCKWKLSDVDQQAFWQYHSNLQLYAFHYYYKHNIRTLNICCLFLFCTLYQVFSLLYYFVIFSVSQLKLGYIQK